MARIENAEALLEGAELALRENRHAEATRDVASAFEIMRGARLAEPAGNLLARAHLVRALAAAGEGRLQAAALDWTVAVALDAKVAEIGLGPYGEAARRLTEAAREVYQLRGRAVTLETPGIEKPRLVRDSRVDIVRRPECQQTTILAELWLDERGAVRGIGKIETNCGSGLILTTLKALASRLYEPARLGDQVVPFAFDVTVNIRTSTSN
jgi:hypothetical protein